MKLHMINWHVASYHYAYLVLVSFLEWYCTLTLTLTNLHHIQCCKWPKWVNMNSKTGLKSSLYLILRCFLTLYQLSWDKLDVMSELVGGSALWWEKNDFIMQEHFLNFRFNIFSWSFGLISTITDILKISGSSYSLRFNSVQQQCCKFYQLW